MCADTPAKDYKDTLNLPKTDFPMRAGLPKREPDWLARWERIGVYDRLRETGADRSPFVLHDGPRRRGGDGSLPSDAVCCALAAVCDGIGQACFDRSFWPAGQLTCKACAS